MPKPIYTNNAASSLKESVYAAGIYLTVATGDGAKFASPTAGDYQILTLELGDQIEIVCMTARTGDVLTVERQYEGTGNYDFPIGTIVQARVTASMYERMVMDKHTNSGVAIGMDGDVAGAYSTAVGPFSDAPGNSSTAVGKNAKSYGAYSVAIGDGAKAYRECQFAMWALPCIPRNEDGLAGYGAQYNSGQETAFASHFVDLGTPQTWAAATEYVEGTVVRPTTPNGYQYRLEARFFDPGVTNALTTGATEPAWPTAVDDAVFADVSETYRWTAADLTAGADEIVPPGMVFYPSEVGFICFNHSGVSAAPYVSIGTAASPTLLVNNQQLSDITAASMRHAFTGLKHGITDLRCKLITPATGATARFHGRFYAKGLFVQTQG